jgi:hypothetical protein
MEPPLAADVPLRRVATRRHLIPYDNLPQVTDWLATVNTVSGRRGGLFGFWINALPTCESPGAKSVDNLGDRNRN